MARKPDRRVERTRRLLREALLSLIRERGFAALSVQDIIDRADVGRATFYAHFDNKEDLLLSGLDGLRQSLKALQRQAHLGAATPEGRLFAFSRELFAHTDEHRDVFQAMVGDRSVALLQQVFRRMLAELVRDDLKAIPASRKERPGASEPVVQFAAGGLFGILMWWLENTRRPSVDEVSGLVRRLAVSALTAGAR